MLIAVFFGFTSLNVRSTDPHRAQRELLSGSQLLGGLPPPLIENLVAASRLVELPARRVLYEAGESIREAFILFSGSVKRAVAMPGGARRVVQLVQKEQLIGPGEVFGAEHYVARCTSTTATLLVAIDARTLREAVHQHSDLGCRIVRALAERQCATEFDAAGYHYGLTGAQRLLDYLLEEAGEQAGLAGETTVALKASKKVIAARIGMTPESLSRNLRELSDKGLIVVDGRNVHIQNATLLDTAQGTTPQRLNFSRKRKGEVAAGKKISFGALVNLCGRPRLTSQRLAVSWGAAISGLSPARERIRLRQFEKDFVRNLVRLDQLDLNDDLRSSLRIIQAVWPAYQRAINEEGAGAAGKVFALSEEILLAADTLASKAAGLAAVPEAHYVNQAGRNRILSQRIGKLFLFREWPGLAESVAELFAPSCEEFEQNLRVLAKIGSHLPELSAQLDVVGSQWCKFSRAMCPDLAYASRNKHARLVLLEGERLMRSVDTTVKLFERLAKQSPPGQDKLPD